MDSQQRERDSLISSGSSPENIPISTQGPVDLGQGNEAAEMKPEVPLKHTKRPLFLYKSWLWGQERLTLLLMLFFIFTGELVANHREHEQLLTVSALAVAVGHGLFFVYLDDSTTDDRHIHQSYITNISLLLVTVFKGSIVAAVGLSFAQHLWSVLRQQTLPIRRIEQLFSIRSNPGQLTKYQLLTNTPMLFAMGIFVWLVPIALIYPPSALTVTSRPYRLMSYAEVPILFPPTPSINANDSTFASTRLNTVRWHFGQGERKIYSRFE